MRRFLRTFVDGGNQAVFNNLLSLPWEVLLDSRQLAVVPDGTAISSWPDSSGNGRNAGNAPVPIQPLYRVNSSPKGLPLADFNAANSQMAGSLPGGGVGNTLGFSFYAYYILDSVPSAGAGDQQFVFADETANGFRMMASHFVGAGNMDVAFQAGPVVNGGGATTGAHILSAICALPNDGTGVVTVYLDGTQVATGTWTANPATTYLVSGNSVQNVWLRGRLGLAGFGKRVDSDSTRKNVEAYLRRVWG